MDKEKLGEWLITVISALVTEPEKVVVTHSVDEQGVLFLVKVSPEDIGKVIGRKGAIAGAIRTLLRSAGFFGDMRASMKVDAQNSNFTPNRDEEDR